MELYLIRHAEAEPHDTPGIDDDDRPLTARGLRQAAALGAALSRRGALPELLLTSPLPRAHQTAVGLLHAAGLGGDRAEVREELADPELRPKKLARLLLGYATATLGIVGHQPSLSLFAGWLLGDKALQLHLPPAGVALFEIAGAPEKGTAALKALLPPELFLD